MKYTLSGPAPSYLLHNQHKTLNKQYASCGKEVSLSCDTSEIGLINKINKLPVIAMISDSHQEAALQEV